MRGHVHRRGKTWAYVVDVGRDPATGRRRQRTKGGFATRKAAEQALAEVIRDFGRGTYVGRDPQTVAEWVERWLPSMASKIRSSTLRDYEQGLSRVTERLGHVRLQDLRPLDIEELYSSLLTDGHRYGGGLAPKTVRNVHIALRRSLADAERFGLVQRNVAALVKAPSPQRKELHTWTADEVRTFLESVEGDRLAAAYRLLATTGMRRGEVLGLRWSCVDLDAGRLQVNQSLTIVKDELVWAPPKTARSRRSLSLDGATVVRTSRPPSPSEQGAPRAAVKRGPTTTSCSATRPAESSTRIASRVPSPLQRSEPASARSASTIFATPGPRSLSRQASIPRS